VPSTLPSPGFINAGLTEYDFTDVEDAENSNFGLGSGTVVNIIVSSASDVCISDDFILGKVIVAPPCATNMFSVTVVY